MLSIFFSLLIIPLLLYIFFRLRIKHLKTYHSDILGTIDVIEAYDRERTLRINNYPQGISIHKKSITKSYWYAIAKKAVEQCKDKKDPSVLFLGLGANTSSALIGKFDPTIKQTIVEIDPLIIRACREYFDLDKLPNPEIICDDAFVYIEKAGKEKQKFDVIVVDIFTGTEPFVVKGTEKPKFIQQIEKILKKDGIVIFNRPDDSDTARIDTRELIGYLSQHFGEVTDEYIHDVRGYRNDVIIARNS